MAKMKKEDLEKMVRKDVKENNWEINEESEICSQRPAASDQKFSHQAWAAAGAVVPADPEGAAKVDGAAEAPDFDVISNGHEVYEKPYVVPAELIEVFSGIPNDGTVDNGRLKTRIHKDWLKVDPAIRNGNPVWKFSVKDDKMMKCTVFLFRSGQKVRIFTPVEVVNPEFK